MEKNKDFFLSGFTRDEIIEAVRKFQSMTTQEVQKSLRSNPAFKLIMSSALLKNSKRNIKRD